MTGTALHDTLRDRLHEAGLRCTPARLDVFGALARLEAPATHRDVCDLLPEMDRITVFRNLVALVDAHLAVRIELGDRVWRYAMAPGDHAAHASETHVHPHFTCTTCGDVQCLDGVTLESPGTRLADLLEGAEVQIRGVCGSCR
ncbi:MAG: transcriptional repressor [Alphaproteobacteria bacterium]|nr:transcriptional repressor [Alphaproteobacteria bacterium]